MTEIKTVHGEIGILKHLLVHERLPARCFLIMEHEGERYTGCLLFDDSSFCQQVSNLLQFYVGTSIREIGALDLAHTF